MSTTTASVQRARVAWLARARDYVELSKPRIGLLVLITVAVSYRVACSDRPDFFLLANVLTGTILVACSACASNQWLERRRDALMARTARRPLPSARLRGSEAMVFAALTATLGSGYLLLTAGWRTMSWAVLTWFVYIGVYTPLKPRTSWNTAVGAVAGAMPVLIGWSAAGDRFDLRCASLLLMLFFWQFPHFMAIAWVYRSQYASAGMRMLPVVDPTGRRAGLHAVLAAAALVPVSLVPAAYLPGTRSAVYALMALALSAAQLGFALGFGRRLSDAAARRLLRCSLVYLPTLLLALLLVSSR